ncbi:hypothetical protein BD779DRAFT_1675324 [Infundibulicybe gibba]|nr:hypothetical protein BD779DRAFT_1675324 [Infundibulicybe gibba]
MPSLGKIDRTSAAHSRRPSSSQSATATHSGAWVYQNQEPSPTSGYTKTTSPSGMIGPTSTFYNPEDVVQQQRDQLAQEQYQRWIDSYAGQQQQQQYQSNSYQHPPGQHIPPRRDQFDFTLPHPVYTQSSTGTTAQSDLGVAGLISSQHKCTGPSSRTFSRLPLGRTTPHTMEPGNSLNGFLPISSAGQDQNYPNSQNNLHPSHSPSWPDHGGHNTGHSNVPVGSRPGTSPTHNPNMSTKRPPNIDLKKNAAPVIKTSPHPSPPVPSARPSKRPRTEPSSANEPASDSDHSDDEAGAFSGGGISVGMGGLGVRGRGSKL